MATNYTYLILAGTSDIDLQDGTNWALVENGYVPNVSLRRANVIGGQSPFEDVTETITVDLFATSAATMYAKLDELSGLVDQASKWRNGELVDPILIKARPQGSDDIWEATIIRAEIILPNDWVDQLMLLTINNIRINITRRGIWLLSDLIQNTATEVASNTVINSAFPVTLPPYSPYSIEMTGRIYDAANVLRYGYFVATAQGGIEIKNGSTWSSGVNASTSGGSVVLTATATYAAAWIPVTAQNRRRMAIFVLVSTQANSVFPVTIAFGNGSLIFPANQLTFYPTTLAGPTVQMVGVFEWSKAITHVYFTIVSPGANRVLNLAKLILVDVDDGNTYIVDLDDVNLSNHTGAAPTNTGATLFMHNKPLEQIAPEVRLRLAGMTGGLPLTALPVPHSGDAWLTTDGGFYFAHLVYEPTATANPTVQAFAQEGSLILR